MKFLNSVLVITFISTLVACDDAGTSGDGDKQSDKIGKASNENADSSHAGDYLEDEVADGKAESNDVHQQYYEEHRERYEDITENKFKNAAAAPLSTFSIDVDTASYSNVRRMINDGMKPTANAVRIEEMINYFDYEYEQPTDEHPFLAKMDVASAPWKPEHRLLKIALKGKEINIEDRPDANLVFLVDVSGSMSGNIALLKEGLKMLADTLRPTDKVSIAVYAGSSGLVLEPTSDKNAVIDSLEQLRSGGSTNGEAGIKLAYKVATENKIDGGINRVILATDGDFNVGTTGDQELVDLVTSNAESGVELSVLGFGRGNYNDSMMEKISNHGNGNYYYIDSEEEAKKVLVGQAAGTLFTIAKDVKIQIEFNPAKVAAYRLIGYENRLLNNEDFNDDTKDAGEIGAGHAVTALYEIIPAESVEDIPGKVVDAEKVDPLVYLNADGLTELALTSEEVATIKLRYKKPDSEESTLISFTGTDTGADISEQEPDFKFCAAVASFGMMLRDSIHKGDSSIESILSMAEQGTGPDLNGYRQEFRELVSKFNDLNSN